MSLPSRSAEKRGTGTAVGAGFGVIEVTLICNELSPRAFRNGGVGFFSSNTAAMGSPRVFPCSRAALTNPLKSRRRHRTDLGAFDGVRRCYRHLFSSGDDGASIDKLRRAGRSLL